VNEKYNEIGNRIINVPYELDQKVAQLKLEALDVGIDSLTDEQKIYLESWKID
jgi:adenosylhomocysteinase